MNITMGNVIKFDDFVRVLERILGMSYNGGGVWNTPRDKGTFDIVIPTAGENCNVYIGDHKWIWMGIINEPFPEDRLHKLVPHKDNSRHFLIGLEDCILLLYRDGEVEKDDFCIFTHSY